MNCILFSLALLQPGLLSSSFLCVVSSLSGSAHDSSDQVDLTAIILVRAVYLFCCFVFIIPILGSSDGMKSELCFWQVHGAPRNRCGLNGYMQLRWIDILINLVYPLAEWFGTILWYIRLLRTCDLETAIHLSLSMPSLSCFQSEVLCLTLYYEPNLLS